MSKSNVNHFHKGDQIMKTKKTTAKKIEKIDTTPDEKQIREAWLKNYVAPKNTAARLCTQALLKGTTLAEMKKICKEYAEKNNSQQTWGISKTSDLTSHCRWLKARGFSISVSDSGKYQLSV